MGRTSRVWAPTSSWPSTGGTRRSLLRAQLAKQSHLYIIWWTCLQIKAELVCLFGFFSQIANKEKTKTLAWRQCSVLSPELKHQVRSSFGSEDAQIFSADLLQLHPVVWIHFQIQKSETPQLLQWCLTSGASINHLGFLVVSPIRSLFLQVPQLGQMLVWLFWLLIVSCKNLNGHVSLQITLNQINSPQVDKNEGVESSQRWSAKGLSGRLISLDYWQTVVFLLHLTGKKTDVFNLLRFVLVIKVERIKAAGDWVSRCWETQSRWDRINQE